MGEPDVSLNNELIGANELNEHLVAYQKLTSQTAEYTEINFDIIYDMIFVSEYKRLWFHMHSIITFVYTL